MIISRQTKGNQFVPQDFTATPLLANPFIPLIVNSQMDLPIVEGVKMYHKPEIETSTRFNKPNTIKNIKEAFFYSTSFIKININNKNYYFAKGVMFDNQMRPLMVCGMRQKAFLNKEVSRFTDSYLETPFSYNDFVMFYASDFLTDSSLAPLNRRLQKEILIPCFQKGIEVRMITSPEIEKNTFARLFEVKKAKSLTELDTYLNTKLKTFLYDNNEDLLSEEMLESVKLEELQNEELSIEEEAMLWATEEVRNIGFSTTSDYLVSGESYFNTVITPAHTGNISIAGTGVGLSVGTSSTGSHSTYVAGIDPINSGTSPYVIHTGAEGMAQIERAFREEAHTQVITASRSSEPSIILIDDTE